MDFNYINEIWRDIEGFEGLYKISNFGRIKSLNYNHTKQERILRFGKRKDGYLQVILCKDGKQKTFQVHRLVAKAFIPNPNNYNEVNHKDENPLNNCVENLEWCDRRYNNNYGTRNERVAKALSKLVFQYSKDKELVKVWQSTAECDRNGFNQGNVTACCRGERKTHNGFIWSYSPINNE